MLAVWTPMLDDPGKMTAQHPREEMRRSLHSFVREVRQLCAAGRAAEGFCREIFNVKSNETWLLYY
jgi:hypothetical protein